MGKHVGAYVFRTSAGTVFLNEEQPNLCKLLDAIHRGEASMLAVSTRAVLHDDPEMQSAIVEMVEAMGGEVIAADGGRLRP